MSDSDFEAATLRVQFRSVSVFQNFSGLRGCGGRKAEILRICRGGPTSCKSEILRFWISDPSPAVRRRVAGAVSTVSQSHSPAEHHFQPVRYPSLPRPSQRPPRRRLSCREVFSRASYRTLSTPDRRHQRIISSAIPGRNLRTP